MDAIISSMIQGYIDAFAMYSITSPALQQQVDDYKNRLIAFAETVSDAAIFYPRLAETGLQEDYSALITKVAMASMAVADESGNVKTDYSDTPAVPVISVRDFVEQYRAPYDEVKKAGYRKRGEAAYENIFAVAGRAEDMLDAQIILEEERLLWKAVTEDNLDIFAPILEAMDPLQSGINAAVEYSVMASQNAGCDEELAYLMEKQAFEGAAASCRYQCRVELMALLAEALIYYTGNRINVALAGQNIGDGRFHLGLVAYRDSIMRTLRFFEEELGVTPDALLTDEGLRIWLLNPRNADELGRIKECLHHQNIDVARDIIQNEMQSGAHITEILMRELEKVVWFDLDGPQGKLFSGKAERKAEELNAPLTYYQYREHLQRAAAGRTGGKG
ncbi:hypothetical protein LJB76_01720 [Clostridia bacterium OttesenSCG-928-O13]|nr:hypothetical protein [Clostridia bacterium OttesenSCG-928-O13]